jgi:hypothetical protein
MLGFFNREVTYDDLKIDEELPLDNKPLNNVERNGGTKMS